MLRSKRHWQSQWHTFRSRYQCHPDDSDPIWQPRFYDFNIWSRSKVEQKLDYMHMNPVRAKLVEKATEWQWGSARWYIDSKTVGLPIRWPPGLETDDQFDTGRRAKHKSTGRE